MVGRPASGVTEIEADAFQVALGHWSYMVMEIPISLTKQSREIQKNCKKGPG